MATWWSSIGYHHSHEDDLSVIPTRLLYRPPAAIRSGMVRFFFLESYTIWNIAPEYCCVLYIQPKLNTICNVSKQSSYKSGHYTIGHALHNVHWNCLQYMPGLQLCHVSLVQGGDVIINVSQFCLNNIVIWFKFAMEVLEYYGEIHSKCVANSRCQSP